MLVLVTAFEPFGGSGVNPSMPLARALARRPPAGMTIRSRVLPVVGGQAVDVLLGAMNQVRPDAVICLGQSARAACLVFERVAVNLRDYPVPDNAGAVVRDEPVVDGAPAAHFTTLPVRLMVDACRAAGVPASISLSAGAFLCNEVMFALLQAVHGQPRLLPAGFIHVPCLPQQVIEQPGAPSMDTATAERGLRAALTILTSSRRPQRTARHRRAGR